ncbi:MAG: hypothetical protein ABI892_03370 [Flavobacterium sp.]
MKITALLYLFLFCQIVVSQNKNTEKQFIEVEITNKHYIDVKDKSYTGPHEGPSYINTYSSGYNRVVSKNKTVMLFDLNGKILQRKGFQIKKSFNSKPKELIEIYNYDQNGCLLSILEQEKISKSLLKKTVLKQFYYNEKKQLTEKTFMDLRNDSVSKRFIFVYDINGNNTKIICDSLHYSIKEYDANNQITSLTTYNNKSISYTTDEEVKIGYSYYDNNHKMKVVNFEYSKQYYPDRSLKEIEKSNDFDNFKSNKKYFYSDNGLLKSEETAYSYYPNNYLLQQTFTVKSDFKNTINRKIIQDINRQILASDIWE